MTSTPSPTSPAFVPVADHALLVEFGTEVDDAANAAVVALDQAIAASPPRGLNEVVPAYVNLLVDFDPLRTDHDEVEASVRRLLTSTSVSSAAPARRHVVQMCVDDEFAPDLAAVAESTAMSIGDVLATHLATTYRVVMYGFSPGYAYMAGVDPRLQLPRKATPVRGVAAGSVIIAGPQCLVTTLEMPAGWWVIGRSPTRILRPESDEPFLFDPGDDVVFEQIDRDEYDRRSADDG